ncbi:unnamed protein product [Mycena citricolor]|uniref:Uncharacterized protein n=1 Tax=Mycena citricolor TaxID=2018698 RepID=A0AAD2Q0S9_9AGAR|nr:unnamed protein product [Mycena citricolor]
MIFGTIPKQLPRLFFGPDAVAFVEATRYVGLNVRSTHRHIFADHYLKKASKGRAIANTVLGLQAVIGSLPVWDARKLYMALIDPHLTHGCEISLDTDLNLLKELEDIQHEFLRRVLGLGKCSMLTPLFTETGIMPIRYRRLILALSYLKYLVGIDDDTRLVTAARRDSIALDAAGADSWMRDLKAVFQSLPFECPLPPPPSLTTAAIDDLIKKLKVAVGEYLQLDIDRWDNPKLYLLRGRLEPDTRGRLVQKSIHLRHYLSVTNPDHRKTLTRLLLSSHSLAIERLRWTDARRPRIDPSERKCRLCRNAPETPEHVLLICAGDTSLIQLRVTFMTKFKLDVPATPPLESMPEIEFLKRMLFHRETIGLVAKFAYEVMAIFESKPMHQPASPLHWLIQAP